MGFLSDKLLKSLKKEKLPITLTKRCRIIAPGIRKGGVTKTATIVTMAAIFAELGFKVLVVDLDDSGDATKFLGEYDWEYCIADVFEGKASIEQACFQSNIVSNLDGCVYFIGADEANQAYADSVAHKPSAKLKLRDELNKLRKRFDFILIDHPPTMGFWSISALYAADYLVTPILAGPAEFEAYMASLETIKVIKELNEALTPLGVFISRPNKQTNLYKEIRDELSGMDGVLFDTEIPNDVKMQEAMLSRIPITTYAPKSNSSKAYYSLVEEVLRRCQKSEAI